MSGPIQTIPQGLLGLLQLKQLGRNPSDMLDEVAPNVEMFPLYTQRLMQDTQGLFGGFPQTTALTTGNHGNQQLSVGGVPAVVPQNETWWIEAAVLGVLTNTIAAADTLTAMLIMATAASVPLSSPVADVISGRARTWATGPLQRPIFAPPGATFFAVVFDILTATSITISLQMRAARIPI